MGLFGKKEKKSEVEIPTLPKLPKLPDFPEMSDEGIRQLPSFPSSQIGKKFSQDTIKDAVSGERGDKSFYEEDLPEEEIFQGNMRRPSSLVSSTATAGKPSILRTKSLISDVLSISSTTLGRTSTNGYVPARVVFLVAYHFAVTLPLT